MDVNSLGAAAVAYMTGALTVYAYMNRNRYLDLALASIAIFVFGTGMLLAGLGVLPSLANVLASMSEAGGIVAVIFLMLRLSRWTYIELKRYLGL